MCVPCNALKVTHCSPVQTLYCLGDKDRLTDGTMIPSVEVSGVQLCVSSNHVAVDISSLYTKSKKQSKHLSRYSEIHLKPEVLSFLKNLISIWSHLVHLFSVPPNQLFPQTDAIIHSVNGTQHHQVRAPVQS